MITRRTFVGLAAGLAVGPVSWSPLTAEATTERDPRLITIVLRGGLDSLHALVPFSDPHYRRERPTLALPAPGSEGGPRALDRRFALHPALSFLFERYQQGEALLIPAAGTGYAQRSHFDGQNVLENGASTPFALGDGWMNRVLANLASGGARKGLAVGHTVPLLLRGDTPVQTWAPSRLPEMTEDFHERVLRLYAHDATFEQALRKGIESNGVVSMNNLRKGRPRRALAPLAEAAGKLLSANPGPRIAVMESGGWDTHSAQAGRLQRTLGELDTGLRTLREHLADTWRDTVVLVISEFGRTIAENGTRGTDHGVGGMALLCGGAVQGGRVAGAWKGLAAAHRVSGRDVAVQTDYRALYKGVLRDHLGLSPRVIESRIFPDTSHVAPFDQLIRTV